MFLNSSWLSTLVTFRPNYLSLLLHKQHRVMGGLLFLIGIPVAWARIYLGVHFPLDIVGAAIVGMVSASLIWYLESCLKPKDSEVK
jgi:membrane-associated phospholipid phosphatase